MAADKTQGGTEFRKLARPLLVLAAEYDSA